MDQCVGDMTKADGYKSWTRTVGRTVERSSQKRQLKTEERGQTAGKKPLKESEVCSYNVGAVTGNRSQLGAESESSNVEPIGNVLGAVMWSQPEMYLEQIYATML